MSLPLVETEAAAAHMATVTNGGKNERLKEGTNEREREREMLSEALMTAK